MRRRDAEMVQLLLELGGDQEQAGKCLVEAAAAADEACVRQLAANALPR